MSIQIQSTDDAWTEQQRARWVAKFGTVNKWKQLGPYREKMCAAVIAAIGEDQCTLADIRQRTGLTRGQVAHWVRELWCDDVLERLGTRRFGYFYGAAT